MSDQEAPPRLTGTVKWFHAEKGYGFIRRDDAELDVFVHITQVVGDGPERVLDEGQRVEFHVGEGRKGPEAMRVEPVR